VFDGDSDYIQGNLANSGDFDFTVSCWLKRDTVSGNIEVWYLGSEIQNSGNTVGYGIGLQIQSGSSGIVYFFIIGGAEIQWNGGGSNFQAGVWNHVVCTRTGIDLKIYLNGADMGLGLDSANGTDPLQLLPNSNFLIARRGGTPHYLDGSISNFKLYDTVLTAQEVEKLYDMGRNGSVANPQPLHIAAPLYAPGTIVQAQYASTPLNNTVGQLITGGELSDAANDVDYLDMNFKPKFANSSILLTAMINNTCTHVASFGFKEDGTIVRTQADNTNSTGGISTIYDGTAGNPNSTVNRMYNINIQVMVPANGTHTRRYNVAANSYWSNVNYNLYINDRNSNDMRSISNMVVYEIVN